MLIVPPFRGVIYLTFGKAVTVVNLFTKQRGISQHLHAGRMVLQDVKIGDRYVVDERSRERTK